MVTLIDRYVFSEWVKAFSLTLGGTLGILVLEDLYDDLPDFLGYGAGGSEILTYYLVLLPSFLPSVIPLSLLVSILLSLGGQHRRNEVIAMRACGLGLFQISRSLWLSGGLLAFALLYFNAHLVPWSMEQSDRMRQQAAFSNQLGTGIADEVGVMYALGFDNRADGRRWLMNRFSEYTFQGFGITVSLFDKRERETERWVANEGYFDEVAGHWVFLHGRRTQFEPESGEASFSQPFERWEMSEFDEHPGLMKALEKRPKDMSLLDLRDILSKVRARDDPRVYGFQVRLNQIIVNPVGVLIVVALAVPFAVSGVRVNPIIGASKAIGLFFAYYVTSTAAAVLGERHLVEPIIAAWLPVVFMFAVALALHRRVS